MASYLFFHLFSTPTKYHTSWWICHVNYQKYASSISNNNKKKHVNEALGNTTGNTFNATGMLPHCLQDELFHIWALSAGTQKGFAQQHRTTTRRAAAGPRRGSPAPCCPQPASPAAGLRRPGHWGGFYPLGGETASKSPALVTQGVAWAGRTHRPLLGGGGPFARPAAKPLRAGSQPEAAGGSRHFAAPPAAPAPHGGRGEAGPFWLIPRVLLKPCDPVCVHHAAPQILVCSFSKPLEKPSEVWWHKVPRPRGINLVPDAEIVAGEAGCAACSSGAYHGIIRETQ